MPWSVAAIATRVALIAVVRWAPWTAAPPRTPVRLTTNLGVPIRTGAPGQSIAISRLGDLVAFVSEGPSGSDLYVRRLNELTTVGVDGTRDARMPFFSPDSQWIGYVAGTQVKKVPVNGGTPVTLIDDGGQRGVAWGDDESIVFSFAAGNRTGSRARLYRASASGGQPEPLTQLAEGEATHRWPQLLNGGRTLLFIAGATPGAYEDATIVVQHLSDGRRKTVVTGGYYGRYLASGHLVYIHAGALYAMPFDLERLEPTGPAVPAVEGVSAEPGTAGASFAVSDAGTLAFVPGDGPLTAARIVWLDREGKVEPLRTARASWGNLQFSPDGRRLAFDSRGVGAQGDIWTYAWDRDTATQLTFDRGEDTNPIWSPDGRYIVFAATRGSGGVANLFVQRTDGSAEAVRLTASRTPQRPSSWHPSGKFIAFTDVRGGTSEDVMILPLEGDSASGWNGDTPHPGRWRLVPSRQGPSVAARVIRAAQRPARLRSPSRWSARRRIGRRRCGRMAQAGHGCVRLQLLRRTSADRAARTPPAMTGPAGFRVGPRDSRTPRRQGTGEVHPARDTAQSLPEVSSRERSPRS